MDQTNNNEQICYNRMNGSKAEKQGHVHEIQGSTFVSESDDPHAHRFAAITGEEIPVGRDHYHEVIFKTDFHENHYHVFCGNTTGVIPIGNTHVHFLESVTTENNGHTHNFRFATFIEY